MNRSDKIYILRQKDMDQISRLIVLFHDAVHEVFYQNAGPQQPTAPIYENFRTAAELLRHEIDLLQERVPTGYQPDNNK